eukprot:g15146.t1
MGEEEDLLGKKPKKIIPPYLDPWKDAMKTRTRVLMRRPTGFIVLYQAGHHKHIRELRARYLDWGGGRDENGKWGGALQMLAVRFLSVGLGLSGFVLFFMVLYQGHHKDIRELRARYLDKKAPNYSATSTPAELGRFMMVLEKAGSMSPFFRDLYTTTSPRLSVNLSGSVKNFHEIVCFLLPMREPEEVGELIAHMLFVEEKRKKGDAGSKTEEQISAEEKKSAMKQRIRGAARNKALILGKIEKMYDKEDEGILKQAVTLEKRMELERLFSLCSSDGGKRVYEEDWMGLRNLFHRNAVHVGENGRKCLKFENFARILLPLTFQLCERPSGGKTVLTEEELWKKFHGNAVVDEKSTIWADVQADILRMKDVSDEDDEKTRLLKIAANALEKFKIEEPVDVYKFGVSGDKKKGRNGK